MEACPLQIFALKDILSSFATSTGLKVNYSKSEIYPINISQERLSHLAATFHCKARTLPFTYLGLPLGVSKPSVQDCLPLTHRIERRLSNTSIFLTQGGKLEMVNSVLSFSVTFYKCSIKVPISILEQLDKYRWHCLWRGGDTTSKKPPLTSWKMVTKPKLKGGMRVLNLRLENEALLLKNMHKFYNWEKLLWVQLLWTKYYSNGKVPGQVMRGSFWWQSILKLLNTFNGIAEAEAGTGRTILFWKDVWNGCIMEISYPHLYSFTKS
jgi:hypothetical protein